MVECVNDIDGLIALERFVVTIHLAMIIMKNDYNNRPSSRNSSNNKFYHSL